MSLVAISVVWWIFAICLVMALGAWMVFAWSVRSGQYDDVEKAARDLLEQDRQTHAVVGDAARGEGGSTQP